MPTVFAVQNSHRYDHEAEEFVPVFPDLPAQARKFGDVEFLLGPTAAPFSNEEVIEELKEKLEDYGPDDWLLLVGNPALIGFAVALAAKRNDGRVQLLQWSRGRRAYTPIIAHLR